MVSWPKRWSWQKTWTSKQSKFPTCRRIVSKWIGVGETVHGGGLVARFVARAVKYGSGRWKMSVTLPGVWYFDVNGAKSREHAMRVIRYAVEN